MRCFSSAGAFSRAQGTIEYVVLLAIIVVIGLVVVVLASGFSDSAPGVVKSKSDLFWSSQDVGVIDSAADSNGDAVFKFKNSEFENVTVTGINVDGVDLNVDSAKISGGDSRMITVSSLSGCVGGSRTYSVKITYKDKYGIQHTVGPSEFVMGCTPDVPVVPVPPFEDGSYAHPFLLSDCNELQGMSDDLDANYALDQNIYCSDTINWNDGNGFAPIGGDSLEVCEYHSGDCVYYSMFTGSLDGRGHAISDLYINRPSTVFVGLLGYVGSSEIKDLGTVDSNITGDTYVGGIIGGVEYDSSISNCYNAGNITGGRYVGGIAGYTINSSVVTSYNTGTITGSNDVGGISGLNEDSVTVTNSYNTGTVNGNSEVGGIAGSNTDSSIVSNSYNKGTINGDESVGGIAGHNETSVIVSNSYNTGTISGYGNIGGIVGDNWDFSVVSDSHNTGTINATGNYVGGVIGQSWQSSVVNNCYNTGTVNANSSPMHNVYIGGIGGSNSYSSIVSNSYNTGTINGWSVVGGIIGSNSYSAVVNNCYNTGTVTEEYFEGGGIVGENDDDSSVNNCYNTGTISGNDNDYVGGVVGANYDSFVRNSFSVSTINGTGDLDWVNGVIGFNSSLGVNLYWLDSNLVDSATVCYKNYTNGDANCMAAGAASNFYQGTYDVYDSNSPFWDDGNWVWSGSDYPKLFWED